MTRDATLRVARPARDLERSSAMYRQGLDLEVLASFEDHDGFDGVVLGHPGRSWHLELTSRRGHPVHATPDEDDLIVLYLPDRDAWDAAVARMAKAGFGRVTSCNPYWDASGATFEDPDGYRVVLQHGAWSP